MCVLLFLSIISSVFAHCLPILYFSPVFSERDTQRGLTGAQFSGFKLAASIPVLSIFDDYGSIPQALRFLFLISSVGI